MTRLCRDTTDSALANEISVALLALKPRQEVRLTAGLGPEDVALVMSCYFALPCVGGLRVAGRRVYCEIG
jgi:hypothetical protein